MVAALFVIKGGIYDNRPGVDAWSVDRDARQYRGPHPVVAHPPCKRWGRYWSGGPSSAGRFQLGDDDGCFSAALWAVRTFGGVIEHPEASYAWRWFGLEPPPRTGGWIMADRFGGHTCCVEQFRYGHRAQKATWLYACGTDLPALRWGKSPIGTGVRMDDGLSAAQRARMIKTGVCQRLSKHDRAATPPEFADLLLGMACSVNHRLRDANGAAPRNGQIPLFDSAP